MLTSCRFIPAGNNNDINDTFFLLLVVGTSSTKYTNSLDVVAIAVPVGIGMVYSY